MNSAGLHANEGHPETDQTPGRPVYQSRSSWGRTSRGPVAQDTHRADPFILHNRSDNVFEQHSMYIQRTFNYSIIQLCD